MINFFLELTHVNSKKFEHSCVFSSEPEAGLPTMGGGNFVNFEVKIWIEG
jgi:hypothetical protein